MRLSQAQFADAIRAAGNAMGVPNHCTKRLVQKWETGEHAACRPDYLRVLQAVTGLSARELGFRLMPDDSGNSTAISGDASDGAGGPPDGAGATLAMSGLTQYAPGGSIEASMDRLRYALEHPSTVDRRTVALVATATSRLFDIEHHCPARLLTPIVERHLAMVTGLLAAARHEQVRSGLMALAGQSAMLAGSLEFDRGDAQAANHYWDAAIGTAQATVDASLLAACLTRHSYAAARRTDPGAAWQLSHDASKLTTDVRTVTWATTRIALHAAQLGEHEAAKAAMKLSLEIGHTMPDPKPNDNTKPWMRFFDHAALLSTTAHTAALLEDRNADDYTAQAVDALTPAKVKSRAIVLAESSLVAAMVGELELCLDYGSQAAQLTRDMDVSIAADLLHDVVPLILTYSDTRPVRELLPQLTRLTRTADLEDEAEQQE